MEINGWNRIHKRIRDIMQMSGSSQLPLRFQERNEYVQNHSLSNQRIEQWSSSGLDRRPYEKKLRSTGKSFSSELNAMIERESTRHGVSPKLVQALVQVESGGKAMARSPKGALGLMQLMPKTAQTLGVNPLDPQQNLSGGIRYLKSMAERFGDVNLALAAYNAGPGAVKKYNGVPPYKETQDYITKVRNRL